MILSKLCEQCNQPYFKKSNRSLANWEASKYCSKKCYGLSKVVVNGLPNSKVCKQCHKVFYKYQGYSTLNWSKAIFCSKACRGVFMEGVTPRGFQERIDYAKGRTGKKCHNWKGGIIKRKNSYPLFSIYLLDKNEQILYKQMFYKNYCRQHRIVVARKLKRPLLTTEHIHHINGNKADNRIENLYLFKSNSEHRAYEGLKNKYILKSNI